MYCVHVYLLKIRHLYFFGTPSLKYRIVKFSHGANFPVFCDHDENAKIRTAKFLT